MNNRYLISFIITILACVCANAQSKSVCVLNSEEIKTAEHSWTLISVERRADCTILEKVVVPIDSEKTWISSSKGEYIEDAMTGKRFFVMESEIGFTPNTVILEGFNARTFKEIYPPLPPQTKLINVSSGEKCFVKRLDLSLEVSPANPPLSNISFFGINIGSGRQEAMRALKGHGFKQFYKEEKDGVWGGKELESYLYKEDKEYPITVKITTDLTHGIITDAEVSYQSHIDIYEVNEHLQELVDEVKAAYPFREFKDHTPSYRSAASMLTMKSGANGIFKNVTIVIFRGYYYIGESTDDTRDDFLGAISFEVHQDGMHNDHVICVRYSDRKVSRYIRRSYGKYRW